MILTMVVTILEDSIKEFVPLLFLELEILMS